MKLFERKIFDFYQLNDVQNMIQDIMRVYPQIANKNFYSEQLDSELEYLNIIPQMLFGFDQPLCKTILLTTLNSVTALPENKVGWHVDSDSTRQVTVLFWPQIDPNGGGEFSTKSCKHKVMPGHVVVLPANELHRPENYLSDLPRISLKWMYLVTEQQADSYRD